MAKIPIVGLTFNRLTVIKVTGKDNGNNLLYECLCICGNTITTTSSKVRTGHTKSCGCFNKERITSHGFGNHPLYDIWYNMIQRCTIPEHYNYKNYGARGITVCDEWLTIEGFLQDMDNRPSKLHSIDRIDNDGNYCKENCKWSTTKEQGNNRRTNRILEYNDKKQTITQWADELGVSSITLYGRLRQGWSIEDTLTKDIQSSKRLLTHNGRTATLKEWSVIIGINFETLCTRYNKGLSDDEILNTEIRPVKVKLTYNNRTETLAEWSRITGIKYSTITGRYQKGLSVEEVLKIKTKFSVEQI